MIVFSAGRLSSARQGSFGYHCGLGPSSRKLDQRLSLFFGFGVSGATKFSGEFPELISV
jgi:hypothetical protein